MALRYRKGYQLKNMNNLDSVSLKNSALEGKGLFAKRPFKKGEVVLGWNDDNVYLTESELAALPSELRRYVALYKDKYLLIAEPERYMNHSCNPNTQTDESGIDIALRDIAVGEEITGDYTRFLTLEGFTCACGAENCRKAIPAHSLR